MLPNLVYIEKLYSDFQEDPESVDPSWRSFFHGMEFGSEFSATKGSGEEAIRLLINAYRKFGHKKARFNPFVEGELSCDELELEQLGFSPASLGESYPTLGLLAEEQAPLSDIIARLEAIYAGVIGYENIAGFESLIESADSPPDPTQQKRILHELNRAEMLEAFLHMKYTGQKRFSVEGGETLIPILLEMLGFAGQDGVDRAVIGMAHRGRLNVLANVMGKSYAAIFAEFMPEYVPQEGEGSGDVKYHKGFNSTITTAQGKQIELTLAANPSHLEAVDPVVEGLAFGSRNPKGTLPILIHGDASVAGQGVVYETMQLSKINGYDTGGTIHIVVNNQIGFTALPEESRSTRYCTDVARGFCAPVFHVNAEDPDSCIRACQLAAKMRQEKGCDVFIDLYCYRKYGHNEGDEPNFTQPVLYKQIHQHEKIRVIYRRQLIEQGSLSEQEATQMEAMFKADLEKALLEVDQLMIGQEFKCPVPVDKPYPETGVDKQKLLAIGEQLITVPPGFNVHSKVKRIFDDRKKMLEGAPLDWGMAEMLAYGVMVSEGKPVRISGQDSCRGTFSHRHAAVFDQGTQERFLPASQIQGARFEAYNSPLSEYAVLCFEFGYSMTAPDGMTIWEAQFGDFANGAQIAIDQFVATSEQKWLQVAPLTLMLPHGYEGQGPEHSSARIERFLQLAANNNMIICNNTTPAQLFHLLHAHVNLEHRCPLVIFMPKALLRYPPSLSHIDDLTTGHYQKVIEDPIENPERLLLCSGKVYYDLLATRDEKQRNDVAIVRIEQLYPFPKSEIKTLLQKYKGVKKVFWVQEEHKNMGAWSYIHELLPDAGYVGRPRSASPAAGFPTLHKREQEAFIKEAFA